MKSDFDMLIEFYKKERKFIERCIKDNIKEGEYMHAHFHSQALFKIDHQLMMLDKTKDPFYDEKHWLERTIYMYERSADRRSDSNPDSYLKKMLEEDKAKLQKLNHESKKPIFDDQKIDDALFSLLDGAHNGFVLYLNVKDNLGITFDLMEIHLLSISISVKEVFKMEFFFDDDEQKNDPLNKFKGLGFVLNDTGTKLVYQYNMKNFRDATSIKTLLSRVIYDIFTYAELDKPASLVYF